MMVSELIELVGSVEVAEDVQKRIKTVGVRGLDFNKAKELGFFQRISNLMCASHASIMAAYRIYGGAASMLNDFGARRNDISKAMGDFEKAFMKFVQFWTEYYSHEGSGREINEETENLYHRIMQWAQIPEQWSLGEEQRTKEDCDTAIKIDLCEKILYFKKSEVLSDDCRCNSESWCVTKYSVKDKVQTTVNVGMDKASAMMVAKRLSMEDADNVYTASVVREVEEKKTVITPFKAYRGNKTVGKLTSINKL